MVVPVFQPFRCLGDRKRSVPYRGPLMCRRRVDSTVIYWVGVDRGPDGGPLFVSKGRPCVRDSLGDRGSSDDSSHKGPRTPDSLSSGCLGVSGRQTSTLTQRTLGLVTSRHGSRDTVQCFLKTSTYHHYRRVVTLAGIMVTWCANFARWYHL